MLLWPRTPSTCHNKPSWKYGHWWRPPQCSGPACLPVQLCPGTPVSCQCPARQACQNTQADIVHLGIWNNNTICLTFCICIWWFHLPRIVGIKMFKEWDVRHGTSTAHWLCDGHGHGWRWIVSCRRVGVYNITSGTVSIIRGGGRCITMSWFVGQVLIKICEYFVCGPVLGHDRGWQHSSAVGAPAGHPSFDPWSEDIDCAVVLLRHHSSPPHTLLSRQSLTFRLSHQRLQSV